jgi:predicted NAD-dependent protein-ADP-ribosyltransferase YbiA (DUF1768 family)
MLRKLLQTGDRELVEVARESRYLVRLITDTSQASPYDRIWGIGFSAKNAEENRDNWGENRLGIAIMKVREELRKEAK